MVLNRPQLPPAPRASMVTDWPSMKSGFHGVFRYFAALVLYLQNYLTAVWQAIVPLTYSVTTVAATLSPYTIQGTDEFIAASAGTAAATVIDLPPATGSGRALTVLKADVNAEDVTLTPAGSDTINGATSYNLTTRYQVVRIIDAAAGAWYVI